MSDDAFAVARRVLSQLACPVAIIAAASGDERSCSTGTAMYVSFNPPMLAVAEHPGSRTCRLLRASGEFSVSVLHEGQQELAMAAGRSFTGPDKLSGLGIPVLAPPTGLSAPAVAGSIVAIWCRVRQESASGDHLLFTGEIVGSIAGEPTAASAPALLRFQRRYLRSGAWSSGESPEGYPV